MSTPTATEHASAKPFRPNRVFHIVSVQEDNHGIGFENKLLHRTPEDTARFVHVTTGHVVLMGRKTFESIGKPLPHRINVVLSRNPDYRADGAGVHCFHDLEEAKQFCIKVCEKKGCNLAIIGGGEIYNLTKDFVDGVYLTVVRGNEPTDAFYLDKDVFVEMFRKIDSSVQVKCNPIVRFETWYRRS